MAHWLIKSEPYKYAWEQLEADRRTHWDGVRNYQARNNLRAMQQGDLCLYYHSGEGLEVVGVAEVVRAAYQDPTTDDERWVAVDVVPRRKLGQAVPLFVLKVDWRTCEMAVVRQSRLSVCPVTPAEYAAVIDLSETGSATPRRATARATGGNAAAKAIGRAPGPAAPARSDGHKKHK